MSPLAAAVRSWKDDYCLLEPGKVFSYSNPGFALAGLIIEELSGRRYADVMDEAADLRYGRKTAPRSSRQIARILPDRMNRPAEWRFHST